VPSVTFIKLEFDVFYKFNTRVYLALGLHSPQQNHYLVTTHAHEALHNAWTRGWTDAVKRADPPDPPLLVWLLSKKKNFFGSSTPIINILGGPKTVCVSWIVL
jgi:hypothetical protein